MSLRLSSRRARDPRLPAMWMAACEAVGVAGLLFHDLRRSGARNYRRAGGAEDVIQRIGGWKTRSMFARYNVVDERDLAAAGERLSAFLTDAASAPPTIVSIAIAQAVCAGERLQKTSRAGEHGQNTDSRGTSAVAAATETAVSC